MLNLLVILYLILLLLRPNEFVPALQSFALLQLLLLMCLGVWVFTGDKRLTLPQFPLIGWLMLAAACSMGFSGWWGGAVPRLTYLAPIVILFVLITAVARDLRMLRRIMVVTIVCACAMVLHGRWQLAEGIGWTGAELAAGRITYAGILNDPNDLGQLFTLCIAFCLYLLEGSGRLRRLLLGATMLWLCYGIYMTDSRGTMLATLAVFAVVGARRFGTFLTMGFGLAATAALAAATRFGEITPGEQSAMERVESWYAGMQMFLANPLFGVGMGNFVEHHHLTAHNFVILPMAELGLFGFVPWVGILWITGRMLSWLAFGEHIAIDPQKTTAAEMRQERQAALGLMAMAVGFVVSSMFLSQSYKHVLFIAVGLIVARFVHASTIFSDAPRFSLAAELPKIAILSLGAVFAMWLITKILL